MSYSLVTPCQNYPSSTPVVRVTALKKIHALTAMLFYGALCAIHQMAYGVGHQGAGQIILECSNKVAVE